MYAADLADKLWRQDPRLQVSCLVVTTVAIVRHTLVLCCVSHINATILFTASTTLHQSTVSSSPTSGASPWSQPKKCVHLSRSSRGDSSKHTWRTEKVGQRREGSWWRVTWPAGILQGPLGFVTTEGWGAPVSSSHFLALLSEGCAWGHNTLATQSVSWWPRGASGRYCLPVSFEVICIGTFLICDLPHFPEDTRSQRWISSLETALQCEVLFCLHCSGMFPQYWLPAASSYTPWAQGSSHRNALALGVLTEHPPWSERTSTALLKTAAEQPFVGTEGTHGFHPAHLQLFQGTLEACGVVDPVVPSLAGVRVSLPPPKMGSSRSLGSSHVPEGISLAFAYFKFSEFSTYNFSECWEFIDHLE